MLAETIGFLCVWGRDTALVPTCVVFCPSLYTSLRVFASLLSFDFLLHKLGYAEW